jgi:hypothetical protein
VHGHDEATRTPCWLRARHDSAHVRKSCAVTASDTVSVTASRLRTMRSKRALGRPDGWNTSGIEGRIQEERKVLLHSRPVSSACRYASSARRVGCRICTVMAHLGF